MSLMEIGKHDSSDFPPPSFPTLRVPMNFLGEFPCAWIHLAMIRNFIGTDRQMDVCAIAKRMSSECGGFNFPLDIFFQIYIFFNQIQFVIERLQNDILFYFGLVFIPSYC